MVSPTITQFWDDRFAQKKLKELQLAKLFESADSESPYAIKTDLLSHFSHQRFLENALFARRLIDEPFIIMDSGLVKFKTGKVGFFVDRLPSEEGVIFVEYNRLVFQRLLFLQGTIFTKDKSYIFVHDRFRNQSYIYDEKGEGYDYTGKSFLPKNKEEDFLKELGLHRGIILNGEFHYVDLYIRINGEDMPFFSSLNAYYDSKNKKLFGIPPEDIVLYQDSLGNYLVVHKGDLYIHEKNYIFRNRVTGRKYFLHVENNKPRSLVRLLQNGVPETAEENEVTIVYREPGEIFSDHYFFFSQSYEKNLKLIRKYQEELRKSLAPLGSPEGRAFYFQVPYDHFFSSSLLSFPYIDDIMTRNDEGSCGWVRIDCLVLSQPDIEGLENEIVLTESDFKHEDKKLVFLPNNVFCWKEDLIVKDRVVKDNGKFVVCELPSNIQGMMLLNSKDHLYRQILDKFTVEGRIFFVVYKHVPYSKVHDYLIYEEVREGELELANTKIRIPQGILLDYGRGDKRAFYSQNSYLVTIQNGYFWVIDSHAFRSARGDFVRLASRSSQYHREDFQTHIIPYVINSEGLDLAKESYENLFSGALDFKRKKNSKKTRWEMTRLGNEAIQLYRYYQLAGMEDNTYYNFERFSLLDRVSGTELQVLLPHRYTSIFRDPAFNDYYIFTPEDIFEIYTKLKRVLPEKLFKLIPPVVFFPRNAHSGDRVVQGDFNSHYKNGKDWEINLYLDIPTHAWNSQKSFYIDRAVTILVHEFAGHGVQELYYRMVNIDKNHLEVLTNEAVLFDQIAFEYGHKNYEEYIATMAENYFLDRRAKYLYPHGYLFYSFLLGEVMKRI